MNPSLFESYVATWFPKLVISVTETFNDKNRPQPYYYRRFLRKEFSLDGKFTSLSRTNRLIMADVVAMDSSIPLKRRPSVAELPGSVPKIATERYLNESDLTRLRLMDRAGYPEATIVRDLFQDIPAVIGGQYEKIEYMFLRALSSGILLVDNTTNVGTGIRFDYGYLAENQFDASVIWSSPTAKPLDDLVVVANKARLDGTPIVRFLLDNTTLNYVLNSENARAYVGGITFPGAVTAVAPTLEQLNTAMAGAYGFQFERIDRSCTFEINGAQTTVNPWEAGQVIGITSEQLGSLVWSEVAEAWVRPEGPAYQIADEFILVKKYHVIRPSLAEFTASESRALPVISDVQRIYKLDSTAGSAT